MIKTQKNTIVLLYLPIYYGGESGNFYLPKIFYAGTKIFKAS